MQPLSENGRADRDRDRPTPYWNCRRPSSRKTRTKATTPRTAAATASPLSNIVIPVTEGAIALREGARGAAAAAEGGGTVDEGRDAGAGGGLPAGGAGGAGEAAALGAVATAGVGILIVGAAVGFGGRLIRTVSFLGWTLAASAGLGGAGAAGVSGVFSAINISGAKLGTDIRSVNHYSAGVDAPPRPIHFTR